MELLDDESLIWQGRPSWRSALAYYLKWGLIALVPAIVVIVARVFGTLKSATVWGIVVSVVLLVLVLLIGWLRRIGIQYTITDKRIVIRHGILSRSEHSAHIDRVQNVNTYQSFFERMLGVGTVDFDTAGSEDFDFKFVGVEDPGGLRQRIDREYRAAVSGGNVPR
jgi:uncharacterized membrane protein YdbT with pleckstrin-like domain